MSPRTEPRLHPKWLLDEKVFCYLDGEKFQATSRDVSAGGIFLRTSKDVPKHSTVVLAFKDKTSAGQAPFFLVGSPVRYQQSPQKGVGIQWLRAVTTGSAKALERFLSDKMQMPSATVFEEGRGPGGEKRAVHLFPLALLQSISAPAAPRDVAVPSNASNPVAPAPTGTVDDMRVIRQDGSQLSDSHAEDDDGAEESSHAQPPVQVRPSGESMLGSDSILTQLRGRARIDGEVHPATVLALGMRGLYLQVPRGPTNLSSEIDVFFYVKTRQGAIPVRCTCRTIFEDAATDGHSTCLDMEILRFEDATMKSVTASFIKWMRKKSPLQK